MKNIKGHVYDTQYATRFHYATKLHGNISLNINCVETRKSEVVTPTSKHHDIMCNVVMLQLHIFLTLTSDDAKCPALSYLPTG
jgi:hypothetical protein